MSKTSNVENDALIVGYDSLAAVQWCTPTFLGCGACISVSAVKGQVTITIELKTPFGNVSKSFQFNSNVNFTWQPFSKFKVTVSISNLNESNGTFSFDLSINPCISIPIVGQKCFNFSHHFVVPTVLNGIQNEIDDNQFTSLLAIHSVGSTGSASLLQGDIYSNYLSGQANAADFPTVPITKCLPIPTIQCVPTITSCVTGISPICAAQQDAAGFPTIPITKCLPIPTVQCVPTITSCVTGISPICAAQQDAAGFPTIPITKCLPIPTVQCVPTITSCVTGISPICAAQQEAAGFPTIPITKCLPIPTVQCVPTITSCVTGISPICAAQNTNVTGAIPTLPVNQCVPTVQCIPTIQCIPTVSCTGIPFIC